MITFKTGDKVLRRRATDIFPGKVIAVFDDRAFVQWFTPEGASHDALMMQTRDLLPFSELEYQYRVARRRKAAGE